MKKDFRKILVVITTLGMGLIANSCESSCSHSNVINIDRVDPTCTLPGYSQGMVCKDCGKVIVESKELAPLGHDYINHEAKAASCDSVGYNAYTTCSRCNYSTYQEISATGHDIIHHEAKAASCDKAGYEAYDTCSKCDYTTYKEIEATGHILKHHSAKAPTCESVGYEAYDSCSKCDYTTYKEIAKLEHSWNSGTITKKATCTEDGLKVYVCSECYETKNEVIPATNHNIVHVEGKEPTCESKGWYAYDYCTNCDYSTIQEIPKKGHNYGKVIKGSSATCTEDGIKDHYECKDCAKLFIKENNSYIEVSEDDLLIEKLEHDLTHFDGKEATCVEDGYEAYDACSRCDYSTKQVITSGGHNYGNEIAEVKATCTEDGVMAHYECNECHKLFIKILNQYVEVNNDYLKIDKINHDLVSVDKKEATCEEDGYEAYQYCKNCEYTTYQKIDKLGHKASDNWSYDDNMHYHTCVHDDCEERLDIGTHDSTLVSKQAVSPTYTTVGYSEEHSCSVCNKVMETQQEIHCLEYTLNFVTYSDDINSITVYNGQVDVTLPNPTRTGYTFIGWYFKDEDTLLGLSVDKWDFDYNKANATLYATYKSNDPVTNGFSISIGETSGIIKIGNLGDTNKVYFVVSVPNDKYLLASEYGATSENICQNPTVLGTYYAKSSLKLTIPRTSNTIDNLNCNYYLISGNEIFKGPVAATDSSIDAYANKNIVFFGDSITAGAWTSASTKNNPHASATNYHVNPVETAQANSNGYSINGGIAYQFATNHEKSTVYNYAISASSVANNTKGTYSENDQYAQFKNDYSSVSVDLFVITITYNDILTIPTNQSHYTYNILGDDSKIEELKYLTYDNLIKDSPLATVGDNNGFTILDTTLGTLINLVQTMHIEYPSAEVVFVMQPVRPGLTPVRESAMELMITHGKKIANAFGLKYCDLYHDSGFTYATYNDETQRALYWEDNTHPSLKATIDYFYDCFESCIK